jgi:hypothetical protein
MHLCPSNFAQGLLGNKMKQKYIVEFNTTNMQDGWSRMEFTSITKAFGFISLMVKRGCHCQIFQI